jgi:hypothetical protein
MNYIKNNTKLLACIAGTTLLLAVASQSVLATTIMVVFTRVSEPVTFGLLAVGLLGLEYSRRKFKRKLAKLPSNRTHDSTYWIK